MQADTLPDASYSAPHCSAPRLSLRTPHQFAVLLHRRVICKPSRRWTVLRDAEPALRLQHAKIARHRSRHLAASVESTYYQRQALRTTHGGRYTGMVEGWSSGAVEGVLVNRSGIGFNSSMGILRAVSASGRRFASREHVVFDSLSRSSLHKVLNVPSRASPVLVPVVCRSPCKQMFGIGLKCFTSAK
jgi:hypothetical protein